MIPRTATKEIQILATQFKAVAVVGPRQSGKTTLVRMIFKDKPYVNLENPDVRLFAVQDPRGFLSNYPMAQYLTKFSGYRKYFRISNKYLMNPIKEVFLS